MSDLGRSKWGRRFLHGAKQPFLAPRYLIAGPRLLLWSIVPIFVSSGLLVYGVIWGFRNLGSILGSIAAHATGAWAPLVNVGVHFLGLLLFSTLLILLVFLISKIVVIPFNSIIAEKTLQFDGVIKDQRFHFKSWVRRAIRLFIIAVFQAVFFVVLGGVLFVLSLIPLVQMAAWYLGLLVVAFDCADYGMELANLSLRGKLRLVRRRLPEFSGFALVMGLTFLIPLLNFFFLPIAVIGATRLVGTFPELWAHEERMPQ